MFFIYFFDFLIFFNFFYTMESPLIIISQSLVNLILNTKLLIAILLIVMSYFCNFFNNTAIFFYFNFFSQLNFLFITNNFQIISQLQNGCMIIHPVLLYLFVALNIFLFSCLIFNIHFFTSIFIFFKNVFFLGFFSIFLGCY